MRLWRRRCEDETNVLQWVDRRLFQLFFTVIMSAVAAAASPVESSHADACAAMMYWLNDNQWTAIAERFNYFMFFRRETPLTPRIRNGIADFVLGNSTREPFLVEFHPEHALGRAAVGEHIAWSLYSSSSCDTDTDDEEARL